MNTFQVSYRTKKYGNFRQVAGSPSFPFNFGELLDESLDEAYITLYGDTVPYYNPTTEMRVTTQEGSATKTRDYIVAKDTATEMPNGSGRYKHDLYLIELTKIAEGIPCQTLTFTNSKVKERAKAPVSGAVANNFTRFKNYLKKEISFENPFFPVTKYFVSPIDVDKEYTIPSIEKVFAKIQAIQSDEYVQYTIIKTSEWADSTNITVTGSMSKSFTKAVHGNDIYSADFSVTPDTGNVGVIHFTYSFPVKIEAPSVQAETNLVQVDFAVYCMEAISASTAKITAYKALQRCINLAEPLFYSYNHAYKQYQKDFVRFRIDTDQEDWLKSVYVPEFTMTSCTFREQLQQIGGYLHAEPRITLQYTSGASYFYKITLDRYGLQETESIEEPHIFKERSIDINQYCTSVDTSPQNLVNSLDYAQGVVFAPNRSNFKTWRTESVNVRVEETNAYIQTQFPIYQVGKVLCGIYGNSGAVALQEKDITKYVFEETEYNSVLSSFEGSFPYAKSYAIYYTIGEKNIKGLFFKPDTDESRLWGSYLSTYAIANILAHVNNTTISAIRSLLSGDRGYSNLFFQIEYIPIYDTRFSLDKSDAEDALHSFSQIYNQSENLVETRYYGENVKGVVERLGRVEETRTYIFPSTDEIPKIGRQIDGYAVSAVSSSFMPGYVKSTVALTKDFNRISKYIGIPSNKRVYEVSERLAQVRQVLLKEYIIVGSTLHYDNDSDTEAQQRIRKAYQDLIFHDLDGIASSFVSSSIRNISAVVSKGYTDIAESATEDGNVNPLTPGTILPVVSSAFGNAMVFSWNYKDNYSAGESASWRSATVGGQTISGSWQQDVSYSDYFGKLYHYYFNLLRLNETGTEGSAYFGHDFAEQAPSLYGDIAYLLKPDANNKHPIATVTRDGGDWAKNYYLMDKDNRESIHVSYMVEFRKNDPDLIIGSALASMNNLVRGAYTSAEYKQPHVYKYTGSAPFSKFDSTIDTTDTQKFADLGSIAVYSDGATPQTGYVQFYDTEFVYNSDATHTKDNKSTAYISVTLPNISDGNGFVIAIPTNEETHTVQDDSGEDVTETRKTGGEILIASNVCPHGRRTIYLTPAHKII